VVIRKNRPWRIDIAPEGRILSTEEIQKYVCLVKIEIFGLTGNDRQIQYIYDNTLEEYPGVGILSASNRDVWVKVCSYLSSIFCQAEDLGRTMQS